MASQGNWTIVFEDKCIIKNHAEGASEGIGYVISDDSFWSDSKFSNIWAIQYGTSTPTNEVEYRDETQHTTYADANLGDISQFSSRWDVVHLSKLQADWDNDNVEDETADEKISRLGARPTSYSS
jgi:hypothetical protein|tara:strand:+ start:996 stop:1370 length:375 start_codon:yes stop_codon:yes gene_type:complete